MHGQFEYQSCVTEVLGLLCERVSGRRLATLLSEEIWAKLGCEDDADLQVDSVGAGVACGGFCATLRDWARVGLCPASDGKAADGTQVVPAAYVRTSLVSSGVQRAAYAAAKQDSDEFRERV